MRLAATSMVAALILLAPRAAEGASGLGLTVEGLYGFARPPAPSFRAAVSGAVNDRDLADDSIQIAGANVLLNFGAFEIGAIVDTTFGEDEVKQTAIGALAGLRLGDELRLDALVEAGGHRFGSVADDPAVVTASSAEEWLAYVGLRPGLAYRVELAGSGGAGLVLGVWGFVRWDVTDKSVPVTVAGATGTAPGDVELGGTTIGLTLRVGIEL